MILGSGQYCYRPMNNVEADFFKTLPPEIYPIQLKMTNRISVFFQFWLTAAGHKHK
jgi:hypothetical protein